MGDVKGFFVDKDVKSFPCGKKGFVDRFRKTSCIKDLDGKILYEGRGSFQDVLEKAVKEGVELPRADLRNREFYGLHIPNAKMPEADFEGSTIGACFKDYLFSKNFIPDISGANLQGANLRNVKIPVNTINISGCDVERADFHNTDISDLYDLVKMKNFDKAYNIKLGDLNKWQKAQNELKELANASKTVNPQPVNIAQLKASQGR